MIKSNIRRNRKEILIVPWFYALFITAGLYKADPNLEFIQKRVDLTLLFFSFSVAGFFIRLFREYKLNVILSRRVLYAIFCFLFLSSLLFLGAVFFDNWNYGFQKAVRFLILTGWAFVGAFLIISDYQNLRQFAWAMLTIATAVGIDELVKWRSGKITRFVIAFGSTYIGTGRILGIGLIIVITYFLFTKESMKKKVLLLIDVIFLFFALFVNGGRGPVIAFGISMMVFLLLGNYRKLRRVYRRYKKTMRLVYALCVMAAVVLLVKGPEMFPVLFSRLELLLECGGRSILARLKLMKISLNLFASSPIFGMGPGCLGKALTGIDSRAYPHNIFLELASETGIIGVMVFVILLVIAFSSGVKIRKVEDLFSQISFQLVFTLSIYALLNAMVSGDLNDNRVLFAFLGILINVPRFSQEERRVSSSLKRAKNA